MKLTHVRLLVSNFNEMFLFYRDVLQCKVTWGDVGENYAQFQSSESTEIAIFSRELMAQALDGESPTHLVRGQDNVVLVFSVDNVDEIHELMQKRGIQFIAPPTDRPDWGIRTAHIRDPEGNLIEFISNLS